jgi:hypothetical protein
MNICPNINDPAWKALEAGVGRFQAMKDFMENNGEIRDVETVQEKLAYQREPVSKEEMEYHERAVSNSGLSDAAFRFSNPAFQLTNAMNQNTRAIEIAHKLADELAHQTGIKYQMISGREAQALTAQAKTPWNGEPAFYIGGIVYFVSEKLNTGMVFHEFGHPIIRSLLLTNPELGVKLYGDLESTVEGQQIIQDVKNNYPELAEETPEFMEEVLVHALEKASDTKYDQLQEPKGFAKFIKDLLYRIKQFLRKTFGQSVNVSELNVNTSINDLADMLIAGKNFNIDTQNISQDDVASYIRDNEKYMEDLKKLSHPELVAMTNRIYDIASKHIDVVMSNKNYEELVDILANQYSRGDLQEIRANISKYKKQLDIKANELKDDMEFTRKHTEALINTLFRLQGMTGKIKLHMEDLSQDLNDPGNLAKGFYYDYLLRYWDEFIGELSHNLDTETTIKADSPLANLVDAIKRNVSSSRKLVKKMQTPAVSTTLYNELLPMGQNLKEKYETLIAHRRKKNAPQKLIDQLFEEYHGLNEKDYNKLQELQKRKDYLVGTEKTLYDKLLRTSLREGAEITPEKIDLVLKGELGDANPFNSFFEGYLYSADPVIGGFALYVKNNINEVMVAAQAKFNEFAMDMGDDLKAAGYNPTNIGELGKKVGFVDKIGRFNPETEKFEEKDVWTLLNPFKGYRLKLNQDHYALQEAQKQYALTGSKEDLKKLVDLRAEQSKHRRMYFHQEYKPEFYEREALLEQDDIGREAAYRRENLFERMRMLTEPSISQMDELQISDQLEQLWREYRQLYSKYDLNGNLKTGMDLDIAQRLREYRTMSSEFYEFKERKGVFQESLAKYEQELIDMGIPRDSETDSQFMIYRQQWIDKNIRIKVKDEFYKRRAEILNRIEEITGKLPDQIKKKIFIREAWESILDLTTGFRDDDGQPVGTELSEGSVAKIKAKQEEIAESMKAFTGLSGLTPAEMSELSGYFHKLKQYKADKSNPNLSQGERARFEALIRKRDEMGLSPNTKLELFSLFEELNGLQKKLATDYYTDIMTNWLSKLNTSILVANGISSTVTPTNADQLLEDYIIEPLLAQDQEFADWFRKNHIRKKRYDKNIHEQVEAWERLYVWNVIRPEDQKYYETTSLKDEQGKVTEQIQGIPSNKYFTRVVKEKWRNVKNWDSSKGLVTTDNKRDWLPRLDVKDSPYINQAYFDLQKNDPKMFTVLQKLTNHHLKNQEGLGLKNRLYLDFPRFRKGALEVLQTRKIARVAGDIGEDKFPMLNILIQRMKNFFRRAKDDAESGFNYKDEFNLVRADMFDDEVSSIPIAGLYDIELDDVSTDITHSMMRYMFSAEHQKKLVQMNPMAQALKSIVNDPMNKVKDLDRINKFNFIHRGIKTYLNKKGKYVRADAINNFIEREFEGQTQAGWTKDMPTLNNLSTLLFKRAAFGFFALNIPSAIKNSMGAKFQGQIEATAGKYMSTASFAQGEVWAFNTMGQISFGIYEKGPKSLKWQT